MFDISRSRLRSLTVLLSLLGLVLSASPMSVRAAFLTTGRGSGSLQNAFRQAAREFGVPEPILLSIGYNETLWDGHGGLPSTSGGYGIMQLTHVDRLTDIDLRGDSRARHPVPRDPALHTLDLAARILDLPLALLERDPLQNIRGAAALLVRYAQRTFGRRPSALNAWYGAVAEYSGSRDATEARDFADTVYATIRHGAGRRVPGGQWVVLAAQQVQPDRRTANRLHLQQSTGPKPECPATLDCRYVPAAYTLANPLDPTSYGNYDTLDRIKKHVAIRYIVIHDTEGSYNSAIAAFQNPSRFASAHYVIRSTDGQVTQMVPDRYVSWHAGDYYVNMHAIGIEHEGVAVQGPTWYTERMYQASARLVRYLAAKFDIPLDRAHIIGHDQVPGPDPKGESEQHWDPGPFWDWGHYMGLLQAPLSPDDGTPTDDVVLMDPDFATNQPPVSYCFSATDCHQLPAQGASFVYLRTAPSQTAPLLADPALHPSSTAGTTRAEDWGDKASAGEKFVLADTSGDWDAIWYGGQKAWFYNPTHVRAGLLDGEREVTPRAGLTSILVYGEAYPPPSAYPKGIKPEVIHPLQYRIGAGQIYIATDKVRSDFFFSPTETRHRLILGTTKYYAITFNHRLAYLRARDVSVVTG